MNWEKCPLCKGNSVTAPILVIQDVNQRCVCDNTGIINSVTGRPPDRPHPINQNDFLKIRTKGREI